MSSFTADSGQVCHSIPLPTINTTIIMSNGPRPFSRSNFIWVDWNLNLLLVTKSSTGFIGMALPEQMLHREHWLTVQPSVSSVPQTFYIWMTCNFSFSCDRVLLVRFSSNQLSDLNEPWGIWVHGEALKLFHSAGFPSVGPDSSLGSKFPVINFISE